MLCVDTYVYILMYVCVYTYIYIYTYIHTYIHISTCFPQGGKIKHPGNANFAPMFKGS